MRHRDKHKTVFLHSLCLEKIITNKTYVHKPRMPNTAWDNATQYIINDRDITRGSQLKSIV